MKSKAIDLLKESDFHIIITGKTGAGKTSLINEVDIPDSKYYDFTKDLADLNYDFLEGRPRYWPQYHVLIDDLVTSIDFFGNDEHTLILDAVEFPTDLTNSKLICLIKKARKHGKRLIIIAFPDNARSVLSLFGAVIHLEMEPNREYVTYSIKTAQEDDV